MSRNNFWKLMISLALCQAAGAVGSIFTVSAISGWYASLNKPSFSPPNWIFSPVWLALYTLMGIALFIVWKSYSSTPERPRTAFYVFGTQLILNSAWSIIFFGLQDPFWAFVDIIALWLAIAWTIFTFYSISKSAAYLLVPYILWVSFAAYLNYSIWLLNPPANSSRTVFCTQEAKLCSDGSSVGRTGSKCEFAACPKEDLIVVESPAAYEKVSSPLVVKGKARGTWFFEASFPVWLVDEGGKELAVIPAQAKTDWMTRDFVDFEAVLIFQPPSAKKGYLIFKKDNPSGLPEHDDELKMPVVF